MDDWKQDAIEAAKHLKKQLQEGNAQSEEQLKEVSNSQLGQTSSGLPPQQNKSGYELGRFRHPSENSPRGQVMLTTTQHGTSQATDRLENAAFDNWIDKVQETKDKATQKDHKNEVAPAASTVAQSSQSRTPSNPEQSDNGQQGKNQPGKSMLDRYSSQPKSSDQNRDQEKAPQQDKGHER